MWDPKAFGRTLQMARKSQGLTQEQLGDRVGVSGQAVSKWENGESCPEVALLPDVCAALEVSADALLGTAQNQGVDALVRGLRDRLSSMAAEERTRRLSALIGHLLLHKTDERADEWAGEDFLSVGWVRDGASPLNAATLLTQTGSILHVRGDDFVLGTKLPDDEIVRGLQVLADPAVIRVLRRLVSAAQEGIALREEARTDEVVRAACDRLVQGDYLELSRAGYGFTARGALIAAAVLLLAELGIAGEPHRIRRAHTWVS